MKILSALCIFLAASCHVTAFSTGTQTPCRSAFRNDGTAEAALSSSSSALRMSTIVEEEKPSLLTSKGLHTRDRYVATNRFAVRRGQQAKFEKRWATRKSRLASLEGFKYFHLMRRVRLLEENDSDKTPTVYDEGESDEEAQDNYVSFTVWDKKSDFSAWRKGDAFKEAHGGTSIGAFLSTMVNSALVLRGPPRPAFYDGLFMQSVKPEVLPETVDGWRNVDADGVTMLPSECFVQLEKFFVPSGQAATFEKEWEENKSSAENAEGLILSSLLRRDGQAKGHGTVEMTNDEPTYVAANIFQDRDAFRKWSTSMQAAEKPSVGVRAPEEVMYEGVLVLSSEDGA